jgi:hypothetical protein
MRLELELLANYRATELIREADHERLVASAQMPGRSLRQFVGWPMRQAAAVWAMW